MDMNEANWEQIPSLPDMNDELRKIRKDIRKRNWKIILTSLILTAAILVGTVQFAIPALEKQYWDPNTSTYIEGVPDLQIAMEVYTELFCPGYRLDSFESIRTDFASYSIDVGFQKIKDFDFFLRYSLDSYRTASLVKNELSIPSNFWEYNLDGQIKDSNGFLTGTAVTGQRVQILSQLPEYMHVLAAVYFQEDLDMTQVSQFFNHHSAVIRNGAVFIWLAVCDGIKYDDLACGFNPAKLATYSSDYFEWRSSSPDSAEIHHVYQYPLFDKDSQYPNLFLGPASATALALGQHITSMLQFCQDQLEKGTGIIPSEDPDYYKNTLAYLEENGIKSHGGYVIATPQALLELYEEGTISNFSIADSWISFP